MFEIVQTIIGLVLACKIISVVGKQQDGLNRLGHFDSRDPRTWHFLER